MVPIGIMQGRLLPPTADRIQCFPRSGWEEEFPRAAQAGLDSIEWIYDLHGADVNPLATDSGIATLLRLSRQHGVALRSVCADYFMDRPLVRATPSERGERLATLRWLLERCHQCGMGRMVLPFVDASRIESQEDARAVIEALRSGLPELERTRVEIHLETSLGPEAFRALVSEVNHPLVKINYDSGNSAALGYDVREEFAAYGQHVGSVHIKDRLRGRGTVPLGTGAVDFSVLFRCLQASKYAGPIVLQAARGAPGGEVELARSNRSFVLDHRARTPLPDFSGGSRCVS